jgi:hypothetical protein
MPTRLAVSIRQQLWPGRSAKGLLLAVCVTGSNESGIGAVCDLDKAFEFAISAIWNARW